MLNSRNKGLAALVVLGAVLAADALAQGGTVSLLGVRPDAPGSAAPRNAHPRYSASAAAAALEMDRLLALMLTTLSPQERGRVQARYADLQREVEAARAGGYLLYPTMDAAAEALEAAARLRRSLRRDAPGADAARLQYERAEADLIAMGKDPRTPITAGEAMRSRLKYMRMVFVGHQRFLPASIYQSFADQVNTRLDAGATLFATAAEARAAYDAAAAEYAKHATWVPLELHSQYVRYFLFVRNSYAAELARHGVAVAD